MPISGGVPVGGFISPTDASDVYATHDAFYGKDGHRGVATLAERNAIPAGRRKEGMTVYVEATVTTYQLLPSPWVGTNADWKVFTVGADGDFVHKAGAETITGVKDFTAQPTINGLIIPSSDTVSRIRSGYTVPATLDDGDLFILVSATSAYTWHSDYDARTLAYADGAKVATWAPQLGSTNTVALAQATSGNQPTMLTAGFGGPGNNRFPCVRFGQDNTFPTADDTDDYMKATWAASLSQPRTIIVVGQMTTLPPSDAATGINSYFSFGDDPAKLSVMGHYGGKTGGSTKWFASAGTNLESSVTADTNPHVFIASFNGASSKFRTKGVTTSGNAGAHASTGLSVGGSQNGGQGLIGKITRVLVGAFSLTDQEMIDLEDGLASTYNLSAL